jgi:hypothetical protein
MTDLLTKVYEAQGKVFDATEQTFIASVLSSVAVYLDEHSFISVHDHTPVFHHADWAYTSESVIGALKSEDGHRFVRPVRYEKTIVRGQPVERWTELDGRLLWGCEVTHWMPYPEPPEEDL